MDANGKTVLRGKKKKGHTKYLKMFGGWAYVGEITRK